MLPLTRSRNRARFFGIPFSPSKLFSAGEQGFFYDPSDLSTLFQDSAGTTPVTGVEQVVGLMLDKSKGLVLGSELKGTGVISTIGAPPTLATYNTTTGVGIAQRQNSTNSSGVFIAATANVLYRIEIEKTGGAGALQIRQNSVTGTNIIAAITTKATYNLVATSGNGFYIACGTDGAQADFVIHYIAQVTGNHATSTGAARPTLSARVNLLTKTEQFDDGAVWVNVSTGTVTVTPNTTVAPNGAITADTLTGSATNTPQLSQVITLEGVAYTFSFYAKADSLQNLSVFDGGVLLGVAGLTTDWQRFSYNWTPTAGVRQPGFRLNNNQVVYLWGADLRVANDGIGIPAYQRVNTATDYDSSGFPLYLRFGGTQAMSTGSIDFTATDKMSVFAGVRKLSDAAAGIVAETSAIFSTTNGTLAIVASTIDGGSDRLSYGFGTNGTVTPALRTARAYAAPITNVLTGQYDNAAATIPTQIVMRVNGLTPPTPADPFGPTSAGNFGNYPLYIGARNLASLFLNGRIYSLIGVGSAVSAGNISATESWVNGRTKAY